VRMMDGVLLEGGGSGDSTNEYVRVVQNKLRNLRKGIEKATKLEKVREQGGTLNEEQLESVRTKEMKVMLVRDLEEICKKQQAIAEEEMREERRQRSLEESRRDAMAEEAPTRTLGDEEDADDMAVQAGDPRLPVLEAQANDDYVSPVKANGVFRDDDAGEGESVGERDESAGSVPLILSNHINDGHELIPAIDTGEEVRKQIEEAIWSAIWRVLCVLHVIDFLNNWVTEEHLGDLVAENLTIADMEGVKYFGKMLTSPDGAIPLEEAIRTSTQHAMNYIHQRGEAFPETSYMEIASTVESIACVSILKNRGSPPTPVPVALNPPPILNFFAQPEPELLPVTETSSATTSLAKGPEASTKTAPVQIVPSKTTETFSRGMLVIPTMVAANRVEVEATVTTVASTDTRLPATGTSPVVPRMTVNATTLVTESRATLTGVDSVSSSSPPPGTIPISTPTVESKPRMTVPLIAKSPLVPGVPEETLSTTVPLKKSGTAAMVRDVTEDNGGAGPRARPTEVNGPGGPQPNSSRGGRGGMGSYRARGRGAPPRGGRGGPGGPVRGTGRRDHGYRGRGGGPTPT